MLLSILSWLGGGPLTSLIQGLNKAYADKLNSRTEEEKIAAQEHIDELRARIVDVKDARAASANLPWWMALIGFMIGFPFGLHVLLVGLGTSLAPLVRGGWLDWLLHIPPFPPPFDTQEGNVIGFFFGFGVAVSLGGAAVNAVRARRK